MNIGVDMDSVIAEILKPFDDFHNRKYGTSIVFEDHVSYDFRTVWHCTEEEMYARIFECFHSPEFKTVLPIEGSQKVLKELSKKHNLHLITSRPHEIEEMTKQWIHTFFPKVFASINQTSQVTKDGKGRGIKKSHICKDLKIDIMIDDHILYALDCADNEIKTLLFEAPWNRTYETPHPYMRKVASWEEVWYTISHEPEKPHY